MRFSGVRVALVAADSCVALTAIGGGIALATGFEGERYPVDWLAGTPFGSYLLPGLILATAVGGSAAVAAVATLRRPAIGALPSLVAGVILMGWIAGEVLLVRASAARSWVEVAYFATGLLMAVLALAVGQAER